MSHHFVHDQLCWSGEPSAHVKPMLNKSARCNLEKSKAQYIHHIGNIDIAHVEEGAPHKQKVEPQMHC